VWSSAIVFDIFDIIGYFKPIDRRGNLLLPGHDAQKTRPNFGDLRDVRD
jgi:hypothetical protein